MCCAELQGYAEVVLPTSIVQLVSSNMNDVDEWVLETGAQILILRGFV